MVGDGGSDILSFLFADLQSSTRLWETVPDAMRPALERHDTILGEAVTSSGGRVVKTTGDGLMAVFSSARDGVEACLEAQRRLQDEPWGEIGPLRVRMGLHAGQAQARGGDYFGPPVYRAARIMAAAHGGQVLLSALVAELAKQELPVQVELRDLGKHRLKDLLQPENIFQLLHPDLPSEFPSLATLDHRPNNLPMQISEFFGRGAELNAIRTLLDAPAVRLVTLTGPGGIGKTRLALQAAADHIDRFADGLFFVDLSPARDPAAAFAAIVRAVGLTGTIQDQPLEGLKEQLRARHMLLLLDNFEQVMDAANGVADLLSHCPTLKILVTSREALRVRGERLFPVPSMALPRNGGAKSAEALADFEAVHLFLERAREAHPTFTLTDDNAAAVADICARLDGLPLALELAAARLKLFSPAELRDRLRHRLELLRGGPRDLPARQQTLRSTIEWSYELLDDDEKDIFRLLAVFSPTQITALEEVGLRLVRLRDVDVVERLTSLANKSLVRTLEGVGSPRLSMLGTIREYAAGRLEEEPEFSSAAKRAHAEYFSDFALATHDQLYGRDRDDTLDDLAAEVGNLRTAWRYWVDAGDFEKLNKLVDVLWVLYDARGWYLDAVELTKDLLNVLTAAPSRPDRIRDEITLRASLARGLMAIRGYTEEVEETYSAAQALLKEAGELPERFGVLRSLASLYLYRAEFDKAAAVGRELLDLAQAQDNAGLQVEGHLVLGSNVANLGDIPSGLDHLDKAIELFDPHQHGSARFRLGPSPGVVSYTTSAFLLWISGYPDRAVERASSSLELARQLNHPFTHAYALFHVGVLDVWRREFELVRQRASVAREVAEEHEYQVWKAVALVLHGVALTGLERHEEGLAQTAQGITLYEGLKTPPVFWPVLLSLRATALALGGRPADALDVIDRALGMTGGDDILAPAFTVLKGDLLLAIADLDAAETSYRRALDVAEKWGTRMSELEAATKLTRLQRSRGKHPDEANRLRDVYLTFRGGLESPSLMEARAVLEEVVR